MKIIHDPSSNLGLTRYGIQIPLTDDRDEKIYHFLKANGIPVEVIHHNDIDLRKEDLACVHNEEFLHRLYGTGLEKAIIEAFELINEKGEYHRYDPSSAKAPLTDLFQSVLLKTKGTMKAVKAAIETGESFFLGGGFHHAMSFGGRGFCLINDVVIAARWAQRTLGVKNVWIIDVDAHKGDGTAEITRHDETIKTLSIHMEAGWPLNEGNVESPWFIPSDVDIPIKEGDEASYLIKLEEGLNKLEGEADLAIVVQGSDPYELDQLPSASPLKLTKEQMLKRDLLVYDFLKGKKIPQTYVLAGGYGPHVSEIYCQFLKEIFTRSSK